MLEAFRHALVGLDLSKVSDHLVEWLPCLKRLGTRRLTLVYVIPLEVVDHVASGFSVDKLIEGLRRDAVARLEDYAARLEAEGFSVESRVLGPALPARRLAEEAEALGVDYVAVGSHGHGWLRLLFVGSTAEELAHASRKPVLVVKRLRVEKRRGPELSTPSCPLGEAPIAAAIGFDEYDGVVLSTAAAAARLSGSRLVLVHVAQPGERGEAEERLRRMAAGLEGVEVEAVVEESRSPHKALVSVVERVGAGMVFVGGRPGTVLHYVVRRAPVHVFVSK